MNKLRKRYGDWAIVAGAALGLGESFCISLAQCGINIVIVDSQEKHLNALSDRLIKKYGIETFCIRIDLVKSDSFKQIMEETMHLNVGILIYNAAFSRIKEFINLTNDEFDHFINVNIGTQLKLVHAFSKRLIQEKRPGGILLMSSLSGLLGMQLIAPYAASKAFAWNLAESLHYELKSQNIDVMACVAGATATEAYLNTNPSYGFIKPQVQQPFEVSELALKKLGKKAVYIPGFSNRLNYFILTRLMPRKMAAWIANQTMKKMYDGV
jgi:short-subunit dehydrogenase